MDEYDAQKAIFSTYLQTVVRNEFLTWKKIQAKSFIRNQVITNYNTQVFTQKQEEFCVQDLGNYTSCEKPKPKKISKKLDLYVIIIKSAYYITPNQISEIVKNYNLDFTELVNLISKAQTEINRKIRRIERLKELVNYDFIKKEELRFNLTRVEENSVLYEKYRAEYEKISCRYLRRKERLKLMRAIPSDRFVGDLLGVPSSTVRYAMKKMYKYFGINKGDKD